MRKTLTWENIGQKTPAYNSELDTVTRQSIVNQATLCEYRVKYSDHPHSLKQVSEQLAFGTCLHYMVEQTLLHGGVQDQLLVNMDEWVEPILNRDYEWSISLIPEPWQFLGELRVAYRSYLAQTYPKLQQDKLLQVEAEMASWIGEGVLPDSNIWLEGTADQVYVHEIRDVKTTGRKWDQAKADTNIQASLYPALVKAHFDGLEVTRFTFDVYHRPKTEWVELTVVKTPEVINAALQTAHNMGLKQQLNIYTPSPVPPASWANKPGWYCSPKYCAAWNICEAKHVTGRTGLDQVAERAW